MSNRVPRRPLLLHWRCRKESLVLSFEVLLFYFALLLEWCSFSGVAASSYPSYNNSDNLIIDHINSLIEEGWTVNNRKITSHHSLQTILKSLQFQSFNNLLHLNQPWYCILTPQHFNWTIQVETVTAEYHPLASCSLWSCVAVSEEGSWMRWGVGCRGAYHVLFQEIWGVA